MLVITQKPGEYLELSDGVIIRVLEVKAGKVRIGVDAPEQIKVKRNLSKCPEPKNRKEN